MCHSIQRVNIYIFFSFLFLYLFIRTKQSNLHIFRIDVFVSFQVNADNQLCCRINVFLRSGRLPATAGTVLEALLGMKLLRL